MKVLYDELPCDRIVNELYAWIISDKRTGLESIFGTKIGGSSFQCVTSSPDLARKMRKLIPADICKDRIFRLVKFTKAEILEQL